MILNPPKKTENSQPLSGGISVHQRVVSYVKNSGGASFIFLSLLIIFSAVSVLLVSIVYKDIRFGISLQLSDFGLTELTEFVRLIPWLAIGLSIVALCLGFFSARGVVLRTAQKIPRFDSHTQLLTVGLFSLSLLIFSGFFMMSTVDNTLSNKQPFYALQTFSDFVDEHLVVGIVTEIGEQTITIIDQYGVETIIETSTNESFSSVQIGDKIAVYVDPTLPENSDWASRNRSDTSMPVRVSSSNPIVVDPSFNVTSTTNTAQSNPSESSEPEPPVSNPPEPERPINPEPEPEPNPDPVDPDPPSDTPTAITLNTSNTGSRDSKCPSGYKSVGTLNIDQNKVYSCYSATHVVVKSGGKGASLRDSKITSSAPYGIEVQASGLNNASDFTMEYITLRKTNNGKAILGGGYTLKRSRVTGGEDIIHINRSSVLIQESILEENQYPSGSHSDAIQLTSGGSGGKLTVEDSIIQSGFREQNAPLQVNVASAEIISRRNWYHGGVFFFLGDSPNTVRSEDDMFAYGTSKFGFAGLSVTRIRPVWWSRQVYPRQSTPNKTLTGEAPCFPGNGTAVTGNDKYDDDNNGYYSENKNSENNIITCTTAGLKNVD